MVTIITEGVLMDIKKLIKDIEEQGLDKEPIALISHSIFEWHDLDEFRYEDSPRLKLVYDYYYINLYGEEFSYEQLHAFHIIVGQLLEFC